MLGGRVLEQLVISPLACTGFSLQVKSSLIIRLCSCGYTRVCFCSKNPLYVFLSQIHQPLRHIDQIYELLHTGQSSPIPSFGLDVVVKSSCENC